MTKISLSAKKTTDLPKKYCRIVLSEKNKTWHRLVETVEGNLEYHLGVGKFKTINRRNFRTLIRSIIQTAKSHQLEHIVLELKPAIFTGLNKFGNDWFYQTLAENLELAQYEFTHYKTKKAENPELKEVLVTGELTTSDKKAFAKGLIIGESANFTRNIGNTSGEDLTPELLARAAVTKLKNSKATVKVLDFKTIKKLKMGLLEAVGKGAAAEPKFIIIEYWGAGKKSKQKPIVLIGKGITYDSGGLNVKPSGFMHEMHMDMLGGASIIGTLLAVERLSLKKNVIALIPAAENSISDLSMRAGDIATSMSGQTVEILHTDAEGRLVLADAMTYAQKFYQPAVMIDVATLTGAALSALGQQASAIMSKHLKLRKQLQKLGEETGDLVWPLPLWNEYRESLMSTRADISNIATNFSRFAGCIEGGTFLSFFADKKIPWVHIDIAPRMESIPSDKLAKGAVGEPVRLLVSFVEQWEG